MARVIKVELPPDTNLLIVHSTGEHDQGTPSQDLPSGGRQRPSRPSDPGYGVEEGGEASQLPSEGRLTDEQKAKLDEFKQQANARLDRLKQELAARREQAGQELPGRVDRVKQELNALADRIKAAAKEAEVKAKIEAAKKKVGEALDGIKKELAGRRENISQELPAKIDELKKKIGSAIDAAKGKAQEGAANIRQQVQDWLENHPPIFYPGDPNNDLPPEIAVPLPPEEGQEEAPSQDLPQRFPRLGNREGRPGRPVTEPPTINEGEPDQSLPPTIGWPLPSDECRPSDNPEPDQGLPSDEAPSQGAPASPGRQPRPVPKPL